MDLSAMDLGGNRTEGNMRLEIGAHHEHSVYFFDFFDDGSWDFFDSGLDFFDSGMSRRALALAGTIQFLTMCAHIRGVFNDVHMCTEEY